MDPINQTPAIYSLGDQALTIDFGNRISEELHSRIMALMHDLQQSPMPGIVELVPAYSTLTIYYDHTTILKQPAAGQTVFGWLKEAITERLNTADSLQENAERLLQVPVCYEGAMAPDMSLLEDETGLSAGEIIRLHTGNIYRVYMLGFLPGFAYMAPLDERIRMSRKTKPRPIAAGSVGIAGLQTGIYPLASPGGWQIIGRTPLVLFNKDKEDPAFFRAGDRVQFYSITNEEFLAYEEGENR